MSVEVLCTDPGHPVWPRLQGWSEDHDARLVCSSRDLRGGDLLFLVSCSEILPPETLRQYQAVLTLHASDLPNGRGWSPHIWTILEGRNAICVSMIEATEHLDRGDIWGQQWITLEGSELYDEINDLVFTAELDLMDRAVRNPTLTPRPQPRGEGSYHRRRTPEDSRLDPDKSIAEQFDLLRVCDPDRFPAFVEIRGHRYTVKVERSSS